MSFGAEVLAIDGSTEIQRISEWMVDSLANRLRRRGVVVAISGGTDSSVCVALAVRALGPERVYGLLLPERDSSSDSARRGELLARHLGIAFETHDIAPALQALGCYRQRDDAIRHVVPEYTDAWKCKIVISGGLERGINFFKLVVQSPDGAQREVRLPLRQYLQIVAATNFKQRVRKNIEYFHADWLNYAVIGTPNRLEYDQGFFVKNGDGAADVKPIAHLYKSQVYQLAAELGVPAEIRSRPPTTDTYSLAQTQEEFFFGISLRTLDVCMYALDQGVPAETVAPAVGLSTEQVLDVFRDIAGRRRSTRYQHEQPLLVDATSD